MNLLNFSKTDNNVSFLVKLMNFSTRGFLVFIIISLAHFGKLLSKRI